MPAAYETPPWTITQSDHRFYYDDGSINTARAMEGANISLQVNDRTRLRLELELAAPPEPPASQRALLEYRVNGGSWNPVKSASNKIRITNSTHFNTGDATINRLNDNAPAFVAGEGIDTQINTAPIALTVGDNTEHEWSLIIHSDATPGDTIEFRAVSFVDLWDGTDDDYTANLLAYPQYPQITITGGQSTMERVSDLTKVAIGILDDDTKIMEPELLLDTAESNLQPDFNRAAIMHGRGSLSPRRSITTQHHCSGNISCEATPTALGYLLELMGFAPTTAGSGPYTHTFDLGATAARTRFGTICQTYNSGNHEAFGGLSADQITLNSDAEAGDPLMLDIALTGTHYIQHSTDTTLIPNGVGADADPPLVQAIAAFEMPSGSVIARVVTCNMTINLSGGLRRTLRGSLYARGQQPVREIAITGDITVVIDDATDQKLGINQAGAGSGLLRTLNEPTAPETSLKITWSNLKSGANERKLDVTLGKILIGEITGPYRRNEITTLSIPFTALFDASTSRAARIVLTNNKTNYNLPGTPTIIDTRP